MRRSLPAVGLLLLATACGPGATGTPAPDADPLTAEVLAFEPQGYATKRLAAISTTPIRLDAFAGWFGGAGSLETAAEDHPAKPGTTYVAAAEATGCRAPESVEVSRAGADLRVTFEGGVEREECVQAVGPVALVAIPSEELRGVRTVNGADPVAAGGPGRLADFVPLGTGRIPVGAAELGDTAALRSALAAAGVAMSGAVGTALDRTVSGGERGFAFVLTGCVETSAVLLLAHDTITADLIGDERTACDAPAYFLVTFVARADLVPEDAVLNR
jgi:hypothetical protein